MAGLNLVIADMDELYVKGLSEYISTAHPTAFRVSNFTKTGSLIEYLKQLPSIDVLLISPEFYEAVEAYTSIKLRAVLSGSFICKEFSGFQFINKYCTGEKLIGEVLHLYSTLNPSTIRTATSQRNTRLIGVYSPAGGVGKTTLAAALSIQANEMGMKTFYLNLESLQSTAVFFNSNNRRNLSYVFYYLKENSSSLHFKLEGIKSSDTDNGVHYFCSPESLMEYEEVNADELELLIKGIKEIDCYDYIFIDMPSSFDSKNYRIMSLCENIVLIAVQETIPIHKCRILLSELAKLSDTAKVSIMDKFTMVINKYKDNGIETIESQIAGIPIAVRIPEYTRVFIKEDGGLALVDEEFRKVVNQLINIISCK